MAKLTGWAIFMRTFLVVLFASGPARVGTAAPNEASAWNGALEQNTPEAYYKYLSLFPAGKYVADALDALNRLGALETKSPGRQIPSLKSKSSSKKSDRSNRPDNETQY